ncbi:MAG: anion permease [Nitrososphaerota archaeon]|nr:anion permease [Nitrososphaerota archaeon]
MDVFMVYIIGIALSFMIAWSIGANDAANPTECAVGAGVISIRKAVYLFAAFTALGALLQGYMVMKTLDRGIVPYIPVSGAFIITLSAVIWIGLCSWIGMPISTTHSLVGAIIGYGIVAYGVEKIKWAVLEKVFIAMIASPILSLIVAIILYYISISIFTRLSWSMQTIDRVIKWLLIGALCFSAYSFGANDVANATGVFVTVTKEIGRIPDSTAMFFMALLGSIGILIGGLSLGPRVIRVAGMRTTRLVPITGFAAELSNATVIYLFTTLPYLIFGYGMPISTTQSSIGSIIGVGLVGGGGVDKMIVIKIVLAWALTLPTTIILSITLYITMIPFLSA